MLPGCVVVLDIGKTLSKLTIWSPDKQLVERRTHRNTYALCDGYPTLDVKGINLWLAQTLAIFARLGKIAAIVPVAHGASVCLMDDDGLCLPPLDYEAEPPPEVKEQYLRLRDPFTLTGSPSLPGGLNVGMQLFWLETAVPEKARRGRIVNWPQYWAWRLSGVAATEVTSLGCHTDLWIPAEGKPSPLAVARGWAERMAPLRRASDVLGPVTEEWRTRCNLPHDCMVLCGMHDSNAALLATRGYPEIGDSECTIMSTGTWFIAMRALSAQTKMASISLPEARDCLVNVDVSGTPVPSSRFMGGREMEIMAPEALSCVDLLADKDALVSTVKSLVSEGTFALPTFQKGVGPFPRSAGHWIRQPTDQLGCRAAAGLYLALMANVSLDLIGSKEALVIEGRFANDPVFTGTLASLRRNQQISLSDANNNLPYGALRLLDDELPPQAKLVRVEPLDHDLSDYAAEWQSMAQNAEAAA